MRVFGLGVGVTFVVGGVSLIVTNQQLTGVVMLIFGMVIIVVSFARSKPESSDLASAAYRDGIRNRAQLAALEKRVMFNEPRSLTAAQGMAIERGLSPLMDWYRDRPDFERLNIYIFPMMTAPDSPQFAQSIGASLRSAFIVHIEEPSAWIDDPPDVTGLMLIDGREEDDPTGNAPRLGLWLKAAFESAGLTLVRREKPSYMQLFLLVGRKPG